MPETNIETNIKEVVQEKYGQAALRVQTGGSSCCGASSGNGSCDPITSNLYDAAQAEQIPEAAMLASLGCGNPTALIDLKAGIFLPSAEVLPSTMAFSRSASESVASKFFSAFAP